MASNEEILFQYVPGEDLYSQLELMLDAARKDEAVAVLEYLLKGGFQCDDTNSFRAYNGTGSHQFTPIEIYDLLKQQNS